MSPKHKKEEKFEHIHGPNCDHSDTRDFAHDIKPMVRKEPKVNRNDPCPCGSQKKHKKCCGA